MDIRIKKFMELQDIDLATPCTISGRNGSGKTTIIRAVLWVLSGKDIDGTTFSENVYPNFVGNISDCNADVSIFLQGREFRKETNGKETRKSGESETTIVKSIATKYYIDGQIVNASSYFEEVAKYTKGFDFQLFANPNYLEAMTKDEKKDIFQRIFNFEEFTADVSTATLKNQIANTNEKIKELKNQVKGFAEVVKPEPIEILDFDTPFEEIELQIKENTPKLTEAEVAENNEIYTQLDSLQKEQFGEFKATETKPLRDVGNLKKELNNVLSSQFNANEINSKIDSLQKKLSKIVALENALSGGGCSTCSLCTLDDCPSRSVGGRSIESIQFELDMMEDKDVVSLQEKIESLIVQKKNAETEFEQAKEAKKTEIEAEIAKIEAENAEIEAENAKIEAENAKKTEDHNSRKLRFEAEKEEKIKELKNRINFAKQVNNDALYEKLADLKNKKNAQQILIDEFNKKMGAFENAKMQIEIKNSEIEKLSVDRAEKEREFILQKEAERNYYENLQKQINEKLPENINLFLYTKNKSNDDYSAVFDLTFDDSKYYSQGQRVVSFAKLCEFFQNEVGVNFPILIDEVGVLDSESIAKISEIKDFIKLQPSNENLKITNLN